MDVTVRSHSQPMDCLALGQPPRTALSSHAHVVIRSASTTNSWLANDAALWSLASSQWSGEAANFVSDLASVRARSAPPLLRGSAFFAWRKRWMRMLVWALGLSCETPAASGPPGLHTTTRELQTCTFERPGASNTTKIPREDPQKGKKRTNFSAGEGKKSPPPFGPPPFGPPLCLGPRLA